MIRWKRGEGRLREGLFTEKRARKRKSGFFIGKRREENEKTVLLQKEERVGKERKEKIGRRI